MKDHMALRQEFRLKVLFEIHMAEDMRKSFIRARKLLKERAFKEARSIITRDINELTVSIRSLRKLCDQLDQIEY